MMPDIKLHRQDAMKLLDSLADESVDLIVTDPPYSGMNRHLSLGKGRIVGDYAKRGSEDGDWFEEWEDTPEQYEAFLYECSRVMKPDTCVWLMFDPYSLLTLGPLVRMVFNVKNIVTWDKVAMGMGHYLRRRSEFIVLAQKGKRRLTNRGTPDVWAIKRVHRPQYPTQKPVELFERMIELSIPEEDREGSVVLDPFMGSGASAVAAQKLDCGYIGADISSRAVTMASIRVTNEA